MPLSKERMPSFVQHYGTDMHGHYKLFVRRKFGELFRKTPRIRWGAPIAISKIARAQDQPPSMHEVEKIEIRHPAFMGHARKDTVLKVAEKIMAAPVELLALYKTLSARKRAVHPVALKTYTSGKFKGKTFLYTQFSDSPLLGAMDFEKMSYPQRSQINRNLGKAFAQLHAYRGGRPAIIHNDAHPWNILYEEGGPKKSKVRFLDMDAAEFLHRQPTRAERMEDLGLFVKNAAYLGLHRNVGDLSRFVHEYSKLTGVDINDYFNGLQQVHLQAVERMREGERERRP